MGVLADTEIRRLSVEGWLEANPSDCRASAIQRHMIEPFAEGKKRPGVISYGLSSYGYDMRISNTFDLFTDPYPGENVIIEPLAIDPKNFSSHNAESITIPVGKPLKLAPHSFALGVSVERFRIPRDVITLCLGKSTYARCGLYVNITPFEPEWEGYPTIELTNPTPRPIFVYPNEGIAQLLFLRAETDLRALASTIAEATLDLPLHSLGDATPNSLTLISEPVRRQQDQNHRAAVEAWKQTIPLDGCRIMCETSYADKDGKYQGQEARVVHPRVDSEKERS